MPQQTTTKKIIGTNAAAYMAVSRTYEKAMCQQKKQCDEPTKLRDTRASVGESVNMHTKGRNRSSCTTRSRLTEHIQRQGNDAAGANPSSRIADELRRDFVLYTDSTMKRLVMQPINT
jgi:hypothetical protein